MDTLGKIMGSLARIKIMRLFLLNKGKIFENQDIVKRSRVNSNVIRRELKLLESVNFIKNRINGWSFNSLFKYIKEFESLLLSADTLDEQAIVDNFKKVGRVKLLVVSGIFIKKKDSRVDLLIVGDKMNKSRIEECIRKLEAEIGAEIVYAIFETKEFIYRLNMFDKLVRDIIDFPHKIILQSKELSTYTLKKL
ncbi:MAG: hypothetical protein AAB636_02325 [Patescibacteria group bacterium]